METALPPVLAARERNAESLRKNVVETAGRLLLSEGPEALTVRRLADELGCSTKILYTMFEGKGGVASALYQEGCARLAVALAAARSGRDPTEYLWAVARAYWDFGRSQKAYYQVMFGGAIARFTPDRADRDAAANCFAPIEARLRAYIEEGQLAPCDPTAVVRCLWASLHGVVSLHLGGHLKASNEVFEETTGSLLLGLL